VKVGMANIHTRATEQPGVTAWEAPMPDGWKANRNNAKRPCETKMKDAQ